MEDGSFDIILATPKASTVTIWKNPTGQDYKSVFDSFNKAYPGGIAKDESYLRTALDKDGNTYIWMSGAATHEMVQDRLKNLHNIDVEEKTVDSMMAEIVTSKILGILHG